MSSILIIGGNSDIGYATAKVFAKNRYNIHLASRNISELQIKKSEIEQLYNVDCKISLLDIENKESVEFFLKNELRLPNIILIAAGLLKTKSANSNHILNVNYLAQVNFIEKTIKYYGNQDKLDAIIGISSVAGDRKRKNLDIYAKSKSSYNLYLQELEQRLCKFGINVINIKPGWVNTKMTKNLKLPKIMTANVNFVGNKIFEAYKNKKKILYVPKYWKIILFFYNLIPEFFFSIIKKK
jgi:decaprenylphospho-beta-D-erythro-pentofuranosid-2-ulose 2-reductase